MEIQDGRYFCKIVLVDTFNLICYLPWFLSVITKRDNFRTRSSDDEGTLTKRHFSQLLPGYQTATLVIMFTKWPLMKDLKRNFADTPRTHSHGDATGVFSQCIPRNCRINAFRQAIASGNRVRLIVSSQDDAVVGLMGR